MTEYGPLRADLLARLLLIQNMATFIPVRKTLFDFVCRGLEDFPGIVSIRYGEILPDLGPESGRHAFVISHGETEFGGLVADVRDWDGFQPYVPYIQNVCVMIAMVLENRAHQERMTLERDQFFEVSRDMMCIAGTDGFFKAVNPRWEENLGWNEKELLSRPFFDFVHPDDIAETEATMEKLAGGTPVLDFRNRYRCRDGTLRWLEWSSILAGGLFFAVARDITQRVEAEEEQRRLEAELQQAQKMRAIGQLTGGVAHDFNNLLTIVSGNLELLERRIGADEKAAGHIATAMRAVGRGAELTRRLLAFSRRQRLEPKVVSADVLLHGMEGLLHRTLGEHVSLEIIAASGLWPVLIDAGQLETALINLAVNASHAMPEGGSLMIEASNTALDEDYAEVNDEVRPGDYVAVRVSDTGEGMSPEVVAKALEPFFTTKETGSGTGLGLSMVFGFIKQSNGHIKIYSEPGHGTTVSLYLPKAVGNAVPEEGPQAVSPEAEPPVCREAVLVVEDDAGVRDVAVGFLEAAGYRVVAAADAGEALRILDGGEGVDLVFSDVILPGGTSGADLAAQVGERWPETKVLLTSGYSGNALIRNGRLRKDTPMIPKPYPRRELLAKVREVLGEN